MSLPICEKLDELDQTAHHKQDITVQSSARSGFLCLTKGEWMRWFGFVPVVPVLIHVASSDEALTTVPANIWLITCVNPSVNFQF